MEYVIKNHLRNHETFLISFPINSKINITRNSQNNTFISLYDTSGRSKWKYIRKYNSRFSPKITEKIENYNRTVLELSVGENAYLWTWVSSFKWRHRILIEEEYLGKKIIYHGKNLAVTMFDIHFIYNLRGYLDDYEGFEYLKSFYELEPYFDILEEIAYGDLDLVELDSEVFFYIGDNNKVNVIINNHPGKNINKDNHARWKEEAEKLRKDYKNYIPCLPSK